AAPAPDVPVKPDDGRPTPAATPSPRPTPFDRATTFDDKDLRQITRPADPWSVARDVPGVVVDRVNVGGSDTALQSILVAGGDPGTGASWTLDGVDVSDPAAVGSTLVLPDSDVTYGYGGWWVRRLST